MKNKVFFNFQFSTFWIASSFLLAMTTAMNHVNQANQVNHGSDNFAMTGCDNLKCTPSPFPIQGKRIKKFEVILPFWIASLRSQ